MVTDEKLAKLVQTKQALARKYERLAATAGSQPKKKTFTNRAEKYRRQAARLSQG